MIILDFYGVSAWFSGTLVDVVFSLSSVTISFTQAIPPEMSDDSQPGGGVSYALAPAAKCPRRTGGLYVGTLFTHNYSNSGALIKIKKSTHAAILFWGYSVFR